VAKPFDATLKHLLERHAADWLPLIGKEPMGPVEAIDADLSTITTGADKVFRVGSPVRWLLHLEMQASRDRDLASRILRYNVLLDYRHRLPVLSVVVLLRAEADGPDLQGIVRRQLPEGNSYLEFRYQVVRIWQHAVEEILAGGLGTLPLAPLSRGAAEDLPGVFQQLARRLDKEATADERDTLWLATYLLMGLRYPLDRTLQLFRGVQAMEESVTYQAIIAEGRERGLAEGRAEGVLQGLKEGLIIQGRKHLGRIDHQTKAAIDAINDHDQLEKLVERLPEVSSWKELLQPGPTRKRNGRRSKKSK
jgi:predicted transposase YdaD